MVFSATVNIPVVDVLHANCAYIYMTAIQTICISIGNTYSIDTTEMCTMCMSVL